MSAAPPPRNLPSLLAALRQEGRSGELALEQNDGVRRLYWQRGELACLRSEVAGEQFGSFLLRRGILDFQTLSRLLANGEPLRLGEKVVRGGFMSLGERDLQFQALQEQVMVHALEHALLGWTWRAGFTQGFQGGDLQVPLDHRPFVWKTFHEARILEESLACLSRQSGWEWTGRPGLLDALSDLPLTPSSAYALSFLGSEPVRFATFQSLSNLAEDETARLLLTSWAVGALALTGGELPTLGPEPRPENPGLELELDLEPAHPAPAPAPAPSPQERARQFQRQARQHHAQGRIGEAIRCLEQSVQLDPGSGPAYGVWLLLGQLRMANPAWSTRAIDALQTAARLRPHAPDPWISMGEVFLRKDFRANALACFQKALELDPAAALPDGVDLRLLEPETVPEPPPTLFSRFKSILGG